MKTIDDWVEVGNQSKKAREELFKLMGLSSDLPIKTVSKIHKAIKYLDDFRNEADARMASKESGYSSNVFYGDR